MNACITRSLFLSILALSLSAGAFSAQPDELFQTHVYSDTVLVEPGSDEAFDIDVDLIVSGPKGFYHRESFPAGAVVEFNPSMLGQGKLSDGTYKYELRIMGTGQQLVRGIDQPETASAELSSPHSGVFSIKNGNFVSPDKVEPVAAAQSPQKSTGQSSVETADADDGGSRDQVIADDLIVQNSLCVGFDCVNGESFGFDTIRMKENNTRIKFQDTSSTSSFPSTDWELLANDSANGGLNRFSINDASAGLTPFTVEGGTPNNSLYVDSTGRVGFRTSTPVLDLHVATGNTPGMRLEQDNSAGFASQVWDIAGNEANFFVRDVSGGSSLPFRIRPGAPTSSIDVAADGDVGIGTASPASAMHIMRSNGNAKLFVQEGSATTAARQLGHFQNNGTLFLSLEDTSGFTWNLQNQNQSFRITTGDGSSGGDIEFLLDDHGNLTIPGSITTGGTECGSGCDYVFDKAHELPSIGEHAEQMWRNRHLPNVGPTTENEPINLSQKVGGMLNELETAHIYIEQLHSRIEKLEGRLTALEDNN